MQIIDKGALVFLLATVGVIAFLAILALPILLIPILGIFVLVTLLGQGLCLLWAPVVAWECALIARQSALSTWRYAIIGAIYAMLLYVPSFYLTDRMRSTSVLIDSIKKTYTRLYRLWLGVIIIYPFFVFELMVAFGEVTHDALYGIPALAIIGAGVFIWAKSRRNSFCRYSNEHKVADTLQVSGPSDHTFIMPFAFTSATIVLAIPLTALGMAMMWFVLELPATSAFLQAIGWNG